MAGMNGDMHRAGRGFEMEPELFMTLNEVEQRTVRASTTRGGAEARHLPGPQRRGTGGTLIGG